MSSDEILYIPVIGILFPAGWHVVSALLLHLRITYAEINT